MSLTDKVRRKLESDDPKCANCRFWIRNVEPAAGNMGLCSYRNALEPPSAYSQATTDLSLCSAWEQKID